MKFNEEYFFQLFHYDINEINKQPIKLLFKKINK